MAQYSTYQSNAAEIPIMRKWLLRALVLSLLIHAVLLVFFNYKKLENFGYTTTDRPALTPVKFVQVKITEPAEAESKVDQKPKTPVAPIKIEETKPVAEELDFKPSAPAVSTLVPEKPKKLDLSGFDAADKNPGDSVAALEKQLEGKMGSVLDSSTRAAHQPKIVLPPGPKGGDGGVGRDGGIPGRATLEQALGNAGAFNNKPIAVQGGALFEWGKAELLPQAIENLQKLAQLIRQNPKATFVISGHTDHTGTHDTNLILSQQRADAVRDWLVANLGIDPMRIRTIGRADDDAFPELGPDKSIEEQAPNRRVEIVIKTRGR